MRFRPKGGFGHGQQKPDREAVQARADVVSEQGGAERCVEKRHTNEIERAENIAAGLPPRGAGNPNAGFRRGQKRFPRAAPRNSRAVEEEKPFEPVPVGTAQGHRRHHQIAATNLVKKVQRLIRPEKKIHKEVIINAETLETRVAVLEDGKLEEFNIERTTEERLVGSIFKGKVRNLEDGLKAAFVDIGFEKNAFLHYWDIVPNQFDSGVEIVEREGRARRRPAQDHAEGHPAPLSARQRNHRAGHQRPDRHQRPARHDQPRAARTLSSCCCRTRTRAAFRARLKTRRNASA
jgi:hypothetical protein